MDETKITDRQKAILEKITDKPVSRTYIASQIEKDYRASKPTIARELRVLVRLGLLGTVGTGRGTKYISFINPLIRYIDKVSYFKNPPAKRPNVKTSFNFDVFGDLEEIFTKTELKKIGENLKSLSGQEKKLSQKMFKRELERFIIEFSWKSSKIEGNTYSLLETEVLIKQKKEAIGHPRYEAVMILNHKNAIEYLIENRSVYKKLTLNNLFQLHAMLVKDLGIKVGIRRVKVGITGTKYIPLGQIEHIKKALIKTVKAINKTKSPLAKALIAASMLAYIQPFEDGNKRTSRTLANAILMAYDNYPISYRDVDEVNYLQAILLFYEQNNIYHLKKIFMEQLDFAIENYFLA